MSKQVEVLKAIKAHSESVKNTNPRTIEVAEWGLTLHVWPLTLGEQQELSRVGADLDMGVYGEILSTIMVRGKNADGHRIFTIPDQALPVLQGAGADLILRVVKAIQAVDQTLEEVKKTSETMDG